MCVQYTKYICSLHTVAESVEQWLKFESLSQLEVIELTLDMIIRDLYDLYFILAQQSKWQQNK